MHAQADQGPKDSSATAFALFQGGPLFRLLCRARLADDALQLARRRIFVITLLTWLPLLLLSAFEGNALQGAAVPFLLDAEVQVRLLAVIPLLILAELPVQRRVATVPRMFLERNLISDSDLPRFHTAVASAVRLRNSVLAEVLLVAIVYGVGVLLVWRQFVALEASTWYFARTDAGERFSLAGMWFGYVSLPVFQFLLCRWYFRIFIWARLLWQISRIPLRLLPTHPDRVGGLGFLSLAVQGLVLLAAAMGALLSAFLADRILHLGAPLTDFMIEIGGMVVFVLCLALGPLLVFTPQLAAAKRRGSGEYGTLAERYARAFDAKWLRGGAAPSEELLGSGDIQSLADLGNSLDVIKEMRFVPVTRADILLLAAVTLAPVAPLLLTMMPLDELLRRLLGVVF
jgi:hypothetical protein